jgi:hypothetical protein
MNQLISVFDSILADVDVVKLSMASRNFRRLCQGWWVGNTRPGYTAKIPPKDADPTKFWKRVHLHWIAGLCVPVHSRAHGSPSGNDEIRNKLTDALFRENGFEDESKDKWNSPSGTWFLDDNPKATQSFRLSQEDPG